MRVSGALAADEQQRHALVQTASKAMRADGRGGFVTALAADRSGRAGPVDEQVVEGELINEPHRSVHAEAPAGQVFEFRPRPDTSNRPVTDSFSGRETGVRYRQQAITEYRRNMDIGPHSREPAGSRRIDVYA